MNATQITLRNIRQSSLLTRRIREKCESLERFHPHILHCRVTLERARHARATGPFAATVRIGIPGDEIVAHHARHADAHLALRDAFTIARRRLKEAASIARGCVKSHATPEARP